MGRSAGSREGGVSSNVGGWINSDESRGKIQDATKEKERGRDVCATR